MVVDELVLVDVVVPTSVVVELTVVPVDILLPEVVALVAKP